MDDIDFIDALLDELSPSLKNKTNNTIKYNIENKKKNINSEKIFIRNEHIKSIIEKYNITLQKKKINYDN